MTNIGTTRSSVAYLIEVLLRITEDLDEEGVDLLRRYRCVVTGSHPEYHTERTLDALVHRLVTIIPADDARVVRYAPEGDEQPHSTFAVASKVDPAGR